MSRYSLCIPSSVIYDTNAYNLQQITLAAYQIAKVATIYKISEIVVLDIPQESVEVTSSKIKFDDEVAEASDISLLLATLLQFFITPPYLVKSVFKNSKFNNKFKHALKLPRLTNLPYMNDEFKDFKEGLSIPKKSPKVSKKKLKKIKLTVTKYVNIGKSEPLKLNHDIPINVRVTVDVKNNKIVNPAVAYGSTGDKSSIGYHVRIAKKFLAIFTECTNEKGYSSTVFVNAGDYFGKYKLENEYKSAADGQVLVLVGNLGQFETAFKLDKLNLSSVDNVRQMFDGELAIPSGVKVEDGALIALTKLIK